MPISSWGKVASLFLSCAAFAQPAASPAFAVVSIKHAQPDPQVQACLCEPPGRIAYRSAPLTWILERAYNLQESQIMGPDWLAVESFDIDANLPQGAAAQQVPVMLRTMLVERFQLTAHNAKKELPSFALVVGKDGSKLAPPKEDWTFSWKATRSGIRLRQRMTMSDLAYYLSTQLLRPVVNETGLEGAFAVALSLAPETPAQATPTPTSDVNALPPLSIAVQEQLGLKLEPGKRPVETLIVDRIERTPAGN